MAEGRPPRLAALDIARGIFLIASVASVSVLPPLPSWLEHAAWFGVTAIDLVFPLFVALSGMGLAFAYRNGVDTRRTARRVLVLLLVGIGYTAVYAGSYDLETLRLTGVLQLYAVLVLLIAVLHRWIRGAAGWAVVTVLAAVLGTAVLWWFAGRCPQEMLSPDCNPSAVVDGRLLGQHMYRQGRSGHDPEGLVAICGAFVTAAAGTTAGHLALAGREGSARVALSRLGAWIVGCVLLGAALGVVVEPFKRLWTPSFALLAGAVGIGVFTLVYAWVDIWRGKVRGVRDHPLAWPLVALGRNSLLVYFGSHLLSVLLQRTGEPSLAEQVGAALSFLGGPRVGFLLANLALWWVVAMVLHRHRIYVRP